jgi:hypothetical protein
MSTGVVRERGTRRRPDRRRPGRPTRRPTAGEVLDLLLGAGLLVLAGSLVVDVTGRPVLWWGVVAALLLLLVRAGTRLRAPGPPRSWDHRGSPAFRHAAAPMPPGFWGTPAGGAGGWDGGGAGGGGGGDGGGC